MFLVIKGKKTKICTPCIFSYACLVRNPKENYKKYDDQCQACLHSPFLLSISIPFLIQPSKKVCPIALPAVLDVAQQVSRRTSSSHSAWSWHRKGERADHRRPNCSYQPHFGMMALLCTLLFLFSQTGWPESSFWSKATLHRQSLCQIIKEAS